LICFAIFTPLRRPIKLDFSVDRWDRKALLVPLFELNGWHSLVSRK